MFKENQALRSVAMLILAIAAIYTIAAEIPRMAGDRDLWDFGAFLASGRAAGEGLDPYGIYPPLTPHVSFPGFEVWNPNLNPPVSALLFQAFDMGEPRQVRQIWVLISAACYVASVALLLQRYGAGPERIVLALWALGLAGFWDTLFLGQIYLPLLLLAVGAWLLLERDRALLAGVLIGVLVAIKPNFLVWPVLLFLAGHRRPALVSLGVAAGISLVPLVAFGPGIYRDWFALVASDGDRAAFLTNASLAGLAARAGLPEEAGRILGAALLLALAGWALLRRPEVERVGAFALLASVMAAPVGWIHYTLFLLPVLMHYWHRPAIWVVAGLLTVPVPVIIAQFWAPPLAQLTLGSAYGWALVLCLGILVTSGRSAAVSLTASRAR